VYAPFDLQASKTCVDTYRYRQCLAAVFHHSVTMLGVHTPVHQIYSLFHCSKGLN